MRNVPLEKDWGDYKSDLDIASAYEMFAGKTNDEMQGEFKKNVIERSSELNHMPIVPFQYYVFGLKKYLDLGDFGTFDKPDAAACFIDLVMGKIEQQPNFILPILDELLGTLEKIAKNQSFFEADVDIYGDFKEKYAFIRKRASSNPE